MSSQYSESSSQDYFQIVQSFLNTQYYKQWERVPQIAYLTLKAMYSQMSNMDEKIAKNSEIITDMDIRLREVTLDVKDIKIKQYKQYKQIKQYGKDQVTQNLRKESAFNKKKSAKNSVNKSSLEQYKNVSNPNLLSNINRSIQSSKNNSVSNTRRVLFQQQNQQIPSVKQQINFSISNGLDQTMLQEVKTLVEAILQNKNYISDDNFHSQLADLRLKYEKELQITQQQHYKKYTEQNQLKINKQLNRIEQYFTERIQLYEKSLIENQIKFSKKIREDQQWLIGFVQDNCLMKNQLEDVMKQYAEINRNIVGKRQNEGFQTAKGVIKQNNQIKKKNDSKKSIDKSRIQKNVDNQHIKTTIKDDPTTNKQGGLDYRMNILKELAECVKSTDMQKLFDCFQKQIEKRVNKVSSRITMLEQINEKAQIVHSSSPNNSPSRINKNKNIHTRQTIPNAPKLVPSASMQLQTVKSSTYSYLDQPKKSKEHPKHSRSITLQEEKQQTENKNLRKMVLQLSESIKNIETIFMKKFESKQKNLFDLVRGQFTIMIKNNQQKIWEQFTEREKMLCQIIEENVNPIKKKSNNPQSLQISEFMQTTKKSLLKLSQQLIISRYLYYGEEQCTDLIHWEKQAYNSLTDNFIWKTGKSTITVMASGLYKIQAGIYDTIQKNMPDDDDSFNEQKQAQYKQKAYLLLNGQPISIFSIQNDLPQTNIKNNAFSGIRTRGNIFSEPVLLPAKSKISVKIANNFYGQAYIQIQRL